MNGERTRNSGRNIAVGTLDRTTAILFPFICRTIFIKVLGEEYLGLGSLFSSILQVINVADLGFSTAISASLYKPIAEKNYTKVGELLYVFGRIYKILGLCILGLGLITTPFLKFFINGSIPSGINIYYLWLIYLFQSVASYWAFAYKHTLLSALQRSDISSLIAAVCRTIISIFQILLVIITKNMYIYALLNVIYTLIYNLLGAYICKKYFSVYRPIYSKNIDGSEKIKRDIKALAVQKIGNTFSISLDSIVISAFLGLSINAIYGNYNYILSSIVIFISLIVCSITASIGNSMVLNDKEKNYTDFKKIFFLHSWIVGWCSICFVILFQDFMMVWMGEGLLFDFPIVVALVLRFYAEQIRRVVLNYKDAAGIWEKDKWKPLIGCIVNITLNILLVKKFGVIGVAISTIVDFALIEHPWETKVLFEEYFERKQTEYYVILLKNLFFTIVNGVFIFLLCQRIYIVGIPAIIVKVIILINIPNFMYYLEFRRDPEFSNALLLMKKILKNLLKR